MKNETQQNKSASSDFTLKALQKLKDSGFRYVQIKGFTRDNRLDYIEPYYFVLIPIKNLPDDPNKKEIYEPINSSLLEDWANLPHERIKIVIEK